MITDEERESMWITLRLIETLACWCFKIVIDSQRTKRMKNRNRWRLSFRIHPKLNGGCGHLLKITASFQRYCTWCVAQMEPHIDLLFLKILMKKLGRALWNWWWGAGPRNQTNDRRLSKSKTSWGRWTEEGTRFWNTDLWHFYCNEVELEIENLQ